MNCYVKQFFYKKDDQEYAEKRTVLVLYEDENIVEGLDLKYLSEKESYKAQMVFVTAECEYCPYGEQSKIYHVLGYEKKWDKAFRRFLKGKFL